MFSGGRLLLATARSLANKIKEPALRVLYRYWDEARGHAPFPRSKNINPADLPTLMPNLILVSATKKIEKFRFQLVGSAVRTGFDRDYSGLTFAQFRRLKDLPESLDDYWITYAEARPTYIALQHFGDHSPRMAYSRLLLPVGKDDETIDQILGGFVFSHARNRPSGSLIK